MEKLSAIEIRPTLKQGQESIRSHKIQNKPKYILKNKR